MDIIWIIFLFVFGACVGSFLNVVICRLPRGQSIVFPGSHCPSCGRAILWHDNIPMLSWLVLRGRCRFCNVFISPRYLLIEVAAAVLVAGLFACYYVWPMRASMGDFSSGWPVFAAHAALLCGLLACSAVDIECYHLPLEVCWFVSLIGLAAATAWPSPGVMPQVSHATAAACIGAAAGLVLAIVLLRRGLIQPSFIDADLHDRDDSTAEQTHQVAVTARCGVNPRIEVLREVLFLAPALAGAVAAYLLVSRVEPVARAWESLFALGGGRVGVHLNGLFAGLFGYLIGGLWIWGVRILGTLGFGREAMGLGDVHLLAAAGAVTGWATVSMAFFLAPIFGLLWALYLLIRRGQRELPYGPWLSAGVLAAMIFHDRIAEFFVNYREAMKLFY